MEQRETAHWIYDKDALDWNIGGYKCSICHTVNNNLPTTDILNKPFNFVGSKFCPECGRKMEVYKNE